MAWIESHQELGHHPKTIRFAELLRVNLPTAVGHLHYFWWWALDFAPSGEIRTTPNVVARACEWRGQPERFRDALVESGFIERNGETLHIHDWLDYAGRLVEKRAANAARMRNARAAHVQRTSGTRAGATVPDPTGPDLTVPLPQAPSEPSEGAGEPPNGTTELRINMMPRLERPKRDEPLIEPPCCPNFARTGEHWDLCPKAKMSEAGA